MLLSGMSVHHWSSHSWSDVSCVAWFSTLPLHESGDEVIKHVTVRNGRTEGKICHTNVKHVLPLP